MNRIALLVPMLFLVADGHSLASQGAAAHDFSTRDPEIYSEGYLLSRLNERSIDPDVRLGILQHELSLLAKRSSANEHRYFGEPKASTPLRLVQNRSLTDLEIERTIGSEATRAGVSPSYFIKLARRESSMNPFARSKSSSAAGLYQFTDNTWLCALKEYGPSLGIIGTEKIDKNKLGVCGLSSLNLRNSFLDLRLSIAVSTRVAIMHTQENYNSILLKFGINPTHTQLYILHFFGQSIGQRVLSLVKRDPNRSCYSISPKASKSNLRVFFWPSGKPKTVYEVYEGLSLDDS